METRRSFLKVLAAATAGIMVPQKTLTGCTVVASDRFGELLPLRTLGATGEKVTMLGLGGGHIGKMDDNSAEKVIEAAIEGGIRFFDNANKYGDGVSEIRFGKYLVPKYRDVSFIMTKSHAQDAKTAQDHLEMSLRKMKTDYVDLWQVHMIGSIEDLDTRVNNRVLEVFREAKESGKARYIGFTSHYHYESLQKLLETTDYWDTCQIPINCFDPNYKSYINNLVPTLIERNIGILAMKSLGCGGFFGGTRFYEGGGGEKKIVPNIASIEEAITFAWSLPVSVLITGAHDVNMLNEKIELAKSFKQMTEEERLALVERLGNAGLDGENVEFYKEGGALYS